MVPIEDQLHNILLGHLGKLSSEDVLEVQQVLQVIVVLVIADHFEGDCILQFLLFGSGVSGHEAEPNVLV